MRAVSIVQGMIQFQSLQHAQMQATAPQHPGHEQTECAAVRGTAAVPASDTLVAGVPVSTQAVTGAPAATLAGATVRTQAVATETVAANPLVPALAAQDIATGTPATVLGTSSGTEAVAQVPAGTAVVDGTPVGAVSGATVASPPVAVGVMPHDPPDETAAAVGMPGMLPQGFPGRMHQVPPGVVLVGNKMITLGAAAGKPTGELSAMY